MSPIRKKDIIQWPEKFKFRSKTVVSTGFTIGQGSVKPLSKHADAVRMYPTPLITYLRSLMALLQ